ncbi:MAG: hypothetical protein ACUVRU_07140 [Anaerolineae bacterium]
MVFAKSRWCGMTRKRVIQHGVAVWLSPALLVLPLLMMAFLLPLPVNAKFTPEEARCILACNPKMRQCGYYEVGKVPSESLLQRGVPPRYKLVKTNSPCDRRMCLTKNTSICRVSLIGQAMPSIDR